MMRRIELKPTEPFRKELIDRTGAFDANALKAATDIVAEVREGGDAALATLTDRFDGVRLDSFKLSKAAMDEALTEVDPERSAPLSMLRGRSANSTNGS